MVTVTIDFNNIVLPRNLDLLKARVEPFPNTTLRLGLILSLPKSKLKALGEVPLGEARVSYINTLDFVESIRGYAYISYDTKRSVCEVLTIEGISMREITLETMGNFPNDALIWLGISTNDPELIKKSQELVFAGFGHPHIATQSPSGVLFSKYGLCMVKINDNRTRRTTTKGDVKYVLKELEDAIAKCNMRVRLTDDAVRYLRDLQEIGTTLNPDGSMTQKEIAGNLRCESVDTNLVHYLGVDFPTLIRGEEMRVPIVPGLYNFHSHPRGAYEHTGANFAWPSPQDFVGFLTSFIEDSTILHLITSIEGVYILSMSEYCVQNKAGLSKDLATFVRKNYDFCGKTQSMTPKKYIRLVNKIKYQGSSLFLVQYLPWDRSLQSFRVNYESQYTNCFSSDTTLEYYQRLYT